MSALTALLNSLHSHLQQQTHLLPPLHAQLGLPESALEDELTAIQEKLMSSVEAQIELRRKEVDMWMQRCEGVEEDCIRYQKALGGHIKSTGNSVGEVRKEKSLPKRFEMASEHQEKLRQLYHTKLEQLTTLANRLHSLAKTLGANFFAHDILDDDIDVSIQRDVTPERFLRLEKELVRGKAEVTKRLQQLAATLVQIDWLYTELGMSPPSLDDLPSMLSPPSFDMPRAPSALGFSHLDPFAMSTPTPASRSNSSFIIHRPEYSDISETECQRIFASFVAKVEEADDEGLPERNGVPIGLEHVEPTPGLIKWAANTFSTLEETKRRRETHIQAMYDELEGLWRRLGVEEADMDAFVDAHRGSTDETVREYEMELERMLELKRERMGAFVASARHEIVKLWDDLMVGDEERADFAPFVDDEHTEELLTIHEDEIKKLKEEKREKAPLLAAIKKYFEICEEEKELASAASDQTRLFGKGARDPGRLLREEKMRKRVYKEKPRLEQDLLVMIPAWEQDAGRPFLVYGDSMLQALMATVSAQDQENKRKPTVVRAGSVPPRSTTPSNSYAPTKSGVVTPAVRPAGSSAHSAPNKRMKMSDDREGRAVLGASTRSNNYGRRDVSPSKIPGHGSKIARPVAMPLPKVGTQHHALGHGRVPSSGVFSGSVNGFSASGIRSASSVGYGGGVGYDTGKRVVSGGTIMAKKASRARRESFKPRPSVDAGMGASTRFMGFASSVREEDEY